MFIKTKFWILNIFDKTVLLLIWWWCITKELWWWLECQMDGDEWLWSKPTIGECWEYGEEAFNEFLKNGK